MSLPPKSDDSSANKDVDSSDAPAKRKRRTAVPAVRAPRRTKSAKTAAPPADDSSQGTFLPEIRERPPEAPAPRAEAPATPPPAPPPAVPEFSRHETFSRDTERSLDRPGDGATPPPETAPQNFSSDGDDHGGGNQEVADHGSSTNLPPAAESDRGGAPSGERDPGQQNQGGDHGSQQGYQGGQGQGNGNGGWQDRGGGGGGGNGRDFWKRNKRGKRGRGGPWQGGGQGGGGQGGGGYPPREQAPPQPLPPTAPTVSGDLPNPARFQDLAALDALAVEISSGGGEPFRLEEVYAMPLAELTTYARAGGVGLEGVPNRRQLLLSLFSAAAERKMPITDCGYMDATDRGAFLVHEKSNYRLYPESGYIPDSLVKRYGLKRGHRLEVSIQAPGPGERCPSIVRIDKVMDAAPENIAQVTPFEELVPYYPLERILLESDATQKDVSMRAVDILTPIGFGQRALIVAPPRTGKTVLLQNIANSVTANCPKAKLILLLIDERPEEVTDFKRHTQGEVVSSTFDETPESHVHCAEMVIEKSRRLVEQGEHVVILLDSITRLARAYNALTGNSGKIMSGGMEATALQKPKRFFGSARNIEGGGSITIIASALIDTGSRMDEVIFEEFKGTGNCELHLDRGLVERRIFPAINIDRSGTRKEELIYHPEELQRIYGLRRAMQGLGPIESMEMLITRLKKTKSNAEFLMSLARQ